MAEGTKTKSQVDALIDRLSGQLEAKVKTAEKTLPKGEKLGSLVREKWARTLVSNSQHELNESAVADLLS